MSIQFDYARYWKKRMRQAGSSLKGVGNRRYSEKTNRLMYRKTEEQLDKAIKELGIDIKGQTVLDAGAGIGWYTRFYLDRGAKVLAVDISPAALKIIKKNFPQVETKCLALEELSSLGKRKFAIVHCFDVLYHITDDDAWEKAIEYLCQFSEKYLIIHDVPTGWAKRWGFILARKHVKLRRENMTAVEKIKGLGYRQIGYYPTHIFYARLPFSLIVNLIPYPFYWLDEFLINRLKIKGLESNCIRIFKKR